MSSFLKDFRNVPWVKICIWNRSSFLHELPYIFFDPLQFSTTALRAKQDSSLHPLIQFLAAVGLSFESPFIFRSQI